MEATIQFSQINMEWEEERPAPYLPSLPQERHFWRIPEFPPIPQELSKFQVQNYKLEYLSINQINYQHAILKNYVLEIFNNTNLFVTHLDRSDSERKKLRSAICAHLEKIYRNSEPNSHIPRNSTPLTEETIYVKESLTPFLGENEISAKNISKLEEWATFPGEGTYNHIEFIRTMDIFQEDLHIPSEMIVGKLHSLFTRTAKKWYYKMRQDHDKHDWFWWKSEIITAWCQ
ncbi:hypothetical protein O181_066700 [Austropuccinia psidii MF-1]|uniref:Uncharacterized protein n=1 Tax=Austropuccinia psidii MF-1 TaxID=1389203 RepID=A0A9Q3EXJ3_9BASI|nr:hypothetical protein [Austropuccinia psidii MF-1]